MLACVYIGIAAEVLAFPARDWVRLAGRGVLVLVALAALHQAVAINAAMLFDPRYDAERWMAAHVKPGDVIETYGQNCFLPRFPQSARVIRVGQGSLKLRNPLPGVTEAAAALHSAAPFALYCAEPGLGQPLSQLRPPLAPGPHLFPAAATGFLQYRMRPLYFQGLVNGQAGYRLVHASRPASLWPIVHIHDSLDEPVWIFERVP